MARWSAVLLLALSACAFVEDVADVVTGAVAPLVAVGTVTKVEVPDDLPDDLTLPEELDAGVSTLLFLADARDVSDLDEAPVAGAALTLSGCDAAIPLEDLGDDSYATVGALPACPGPFGVDGEARDKALDVPVTLPAPQDPGVPLVWTAGDDLVLALDGADWHAALVVVIDATDGAVTHSNEPDTVSGWYQLLKGQQDLSAVRIPGDAFRADRAHVVTVTGLLRTRAADLDGVNTILSTVAGGRSTAHVVTTD